MALSMDEQRMLAEIERRLSAEDPGLAARLSSFKRPGPGVMKSPRSKVVGSLFAVAAALALSVMIYAMIPFRAAHAPTGGTNPQATGGVSASAPVKPAGKNPSPAKASTGKAGPAESVRNRARAG